MSTPDLHLQTLFVLDGEGRILSTREPGAGRGPLFALVRSALACAWAVGAGVPAAIARELDGLAREEPPVLDLRRPPVHADRYVALLAGRRRTGFPAEAPRQSGGPAFTFPETLAEPGGVAAVTDERLLAHNFQGWIPGELAAGREPMMAVFQDGYPASICFCARRSPVAAEAGLETAPAYRGRGFAPRVTAAWALAVRASGRVPLYSTAWTNAASLAVARKLGLIVYASGWSLSD